MNTTARVHLTVSAAQARARRHSRTRAWVLIGVHVLIAVHIAHWLIAGRTVAPAELNESMFTLEQGAITVGAILTLLILLSVLVFGRFFCSWGCHVLALQDLSAWLLERVGVRPKPMRSRLVPLVALSAAATMFLWPQVERLQAGAAWPGLRVTTDAEGLGSLMTSDFLRNLPGPWVTAATFLICGGVLVWMLGTRSFCRMICPYGAVFGLTDRFSVGGIRLRGDCDGCGLCTAACTSQIRVHEEIARHGRVVSPNCLKDLDCVKSCPRDAIAWGFGAPSLFRSLTEWQRMRSAWSFGEDALLLIVALICTVIFRSLYGEVPFFLAMGLGVIGGWIAVTTVRMFRLENVRAIQLQLRLRGKTTRAGFGWLVAVAALALFTAHSGWIRVHEQLGRAAWAQCTAQSTAQPAPDVAARAVQHLGLVSQYGLWSPPYIDRMLSDVHLQMGRPDLALPHVRRMTEHWPNDQARWAQLANTLAAVGDVDGASQVAAAHQLVHLP